MASESYFLLARNHAILGWFQTLYDARDVLHATLSGQYVARNDGVVMAYMSRENQPWKAISKVSAETRAMMLAYTKLGLMVPRTGPSPESGRQLVDC